MKRSIKNVAREKAEKAKEAKKTDLEYKKKIKEKHKTTAMRVSEARRPFQHYIRLRDRDKPCVSCGTVTTDLWDGGHYFKAEIYSEITFNENNCHKQCRRCNKYLDGNEAMYRIGIEKRIGTEAFKELERLALECKHKPHNWTRDDLTKIKEYYTLKVKSLKENQ